MFQVSVAKILKYAHALLHILHVIDSSTATLRLQNCILMNDLVNLRDADDSNFEIDRLLELLNNNLKIFQQERSYYSLFSDSLLEK
jgi:hypothetical protein